MRQQNGRPKVKDLHNLVDKAKAGAKAEQKQPAAEYFVDEDEGARMKALSDDLAFVCPLVDGRLKDIAEGKH